MIRLPFTPLFAIVAAGAVTTALVACGSIDDPSKVNDPPVAKVSGALSGTVVPDGTRVALVWKASDNGLAIGSDVAVTGGHFAMDLAAPPANYLVQADADNYDDAVSGGTALNTPTVSGGSAGTNGSADASPTTGSAPAIFTQDVVTGTTISQPLQVAIAGFIVYADKNGNGQLDIDPHTGETKDTILGGADDLVLTYFAGGGSLDYEKLRDHSGILPHAGYNLSWSEQGRWIGLDLVELELKDGAALPYSVCGSASTSSSADASASEFPLPDAPGLHCSDDGRSFNMDESAECAPASAIPPGVCNNNVIVESCGDVSAGALGSSPTIPDGWPCPVAGSNTDTPGRVTVDAGTVTVVDIDGGVTTYVDSGTPGIDSGTP